MKGRTEMIDDGDPLLRVEGSDPVTPCKGCVIIDRLATRRRGRLARSETTSVENAMSSKSGAMLEKTTRYSQLVREERLLPSQIVARIAEVKLDRVTGEKTVAGRS
jgi:hypothetical protein